MPNPFARIRVSPARLLPILGIAVAVALLTAAAPAASPAACGGFHAMGPFSTALGASSHRDVACLSCHASSPVERIRFVTSDMPRMYAGAVTGEPLGTGGTRVAGAACASCHGSVLRGTTEARGLRIDHGKCAASAECGSCHGPVAHGAATRYKRTYVMESCVTCHESKGAPKACDSCHDGKLQRERLAKGPWQVTHGPTWKTTHGAGTLTYCGTCHPKDYCSRCHGVALPHPGDFGSTHGALAKRDPKPCASCHERASFCDSCHGTPMPHPAGFMKQHSRTAASTKDPACLRCHQQRDCEACHVKHLHPGRTNGTLSGAPLPEVKR